MLSKKNPYRPIKNKSPIEELKQPYSQVKWFLPYICAINSLGVRHFSAILFLFSFLIISFSKNIVILNFYANRGALAEKYCVNKYKPSLHCNGHCFLVKQLKKEQQRESKELGDQMSKLDVVFFKSYFPAVKPELYELAVVCKTYSYYNCHYTRDITLSIFKPPRA